VAVPFRIGVMQLTMEPLDEMLASARAMDEAGMDTVWLAEAYPWWRKHQMEARGSTVVSALMARETKNLTIAWGIISPYARHPIQVAMEARVTQEATGGGRFRTLTTEFAPDRFHAITGLWCPGCGSLRAVNDLTHGDLLGAVSSNLVLVLALPLVALWWGRWLHTEWTGRRRPATGLATSTVFLLVVPVLVFAVVRNLPLGSWLAP